VGGRGGRGGRGTDKRVGVRGKGKRGIEREREREILTTHMQDVCLPDPPLSAL